MSMTSSMPESDENTVITRPHGGSSEPTSSRNRPMTLPAGRPAVEGFVQPLGQPLILRRRQVRRVEDDQVERAANPVVQIRPDDAHAVPAGVLTGERADVRGRDVGDIFQKQRYDAGAGADFQHSFSPGLTSASAASTSMNESSPGS